VALQQATHGRGGCCRLLHCCRLGGLCAAGLLLRQALGQRLVCPDARAPPRRAAVLLTLRQRRDELRFGGPSERP
jgi:hypothetical protein